MNPAWFAGRLRELREQAGLSREQLAERAGMKIGGIRDLEQGRRQPALATLVSLCQALDVSCDVLLAKPSDDLAPVKLGRPKKRADDPQQDADARALDPIDPERACGPRPASEATGKKAKKPRQRKGK
jgi:transcriptional regulator with XRE-family HTH domain